jgi:hypothetical protein
MAIAAARDVQVHPPFLSDHLYKELASSDSHTTQILLLRRSLSSSFCSSTATAAFNLNTKLCAHRDAWRRWDSGWAGAHGAALPGGCVQHQEGTHAGEGARPQQGNGRRRIGRRQGARRAGHGGTRRPSGARARAGEEHGRGLG